MDVKLKAALLDDYKKPINLPRLQEDKHRVCSTTIIQRVAVNADDIRENTFYLSCCCKRETWNEQITTLPSSSIVGDLLQV